MDFIKKNLYKLIAAVLVVVALCLLFAPCIGLEIKNTDKLVDTYSGFNAIFGYTSDKLEIEYFSFSFMNLLTVLIVIAGAVLAFIKLPYGNYISGGVLVLGAIFMFLMATFAVSPEVIGKVNDTVLQPCAIVNGILCILAGGLLIAEPFLPKLDK